MALNMFTKTDPAEKRQRALEGQLKTARASRDDLAARRKMAETAAATHRAKASELASEGADDKTLSATENAMRREQDRAATLSDALIKTESLIANLENEIATVLDQRCRVETAAAVTAIVEKLVSARTAFDAAVAQLIDAARESAVIVMDAGPLKIFAETIQQQLPPEIDFVAGVLEGHAKAVLSGTAPASLPKLPEPVQPKIVEQVPIERVFTLRVVRWRDAHGVEQVADQYTDADMTLAAAARGKRCHAITSLGDNRRRELLNAHGGRHPNRAHALDLDDETATRPPHAPHIEPVLASAPSAKVEPAVVRTVRDPVTGTEFVEHRGLAVVGFAKVS
jgi:hypothetical protein